jgi:acyl-CoA synthetase (AMP-forming)/AMP-acid ligase II
MTPETIVELLRKGADNDVALSTPGGVPLTYGGLRALVSDTVMEISRYAIGAGDRVAIVLDNGPEMAAAFLSIATGATAVSRRGVRVLPDRPAREAAHRRRREGFAGDRRRRKARHSGRAARA